MRGAAILLVLWLVSGGTAWADAPRATWRIPTDPVRVGDRIEVTLEVVHGPGAVVDWGDAWSITGLELTAQVVLPTEGADGDRQVSRRRFSLYADLPGDYTLPGTVLTVSGPGGEREVTVAEKVVSAAGVFDPEHPPAEPAPARDTVPMPFPWGQLAALVLAFGGLAAAGVWAMRRRTQGAVSSVPPAPVYRPPAHRVALDRLKQLERSNPDPRATVLAISDIVRSYLAEGFGIDAPTQTSIETGIRISEQGNPILGRVTGWLIRWDLVRFARGEPSRQEAVQTLLEVRDWVRETAPDAPPAVGETA
ncbi:MAG: hypothetical protein OEY97_07465 [Nitrospirota bacterium]|nr:hypothetical protein [Nitrospirota bacterium]